MKRSHYLGIGLLIIAAICIAVFSIFLKFKQSMYPLAPSMPPVVNQTTEEILSQLELVLSKKAPQVLTNLQPGLSLEKINELEHQSNVLLPTEIKALYHWRNGLKPEIINSKGFRVAGPIPGHYFLPLQEALNHNLSLSDQAANATFIQRTAFNSLAGYTKSWIPLFDDGAGDGYFFDPKRKPSDGAVFYHFMEDGEYIFFPSAKNLYAGVLKCYELNIFTWQDGTNGATLNEDFEAASKIWPQFGSSLAQ